MEAASPGPALRAALAGLPRPAAAPAILALGKAAGPMARTAAEFLREWSLEPTLGVIVVPEWEPAPHPALAVVVGDHPVPGRRSFAAADAVASVVERARTGEETWVLLSGGATSLIAAPELPGGEADVIRLFELLLGSGLDIHEMNLVRKRFTRWGGGKLARALAPSRVHAFLVSDVIGDRLESIASGPCVPDPSFAADVRELLTRAGLLDRLPERLLEHLARVERGEALETPKPALVSVFSGVEHRVIASNRLAVAAAAEAARKAGFDVTVIDAPLEGEAAEAGRALARRLVDAPVGTCVVQGGETTVTLGDAPGLGGRNQELALAAAEVLAGGGGAWLMSAGTDGRDGPTDAAGAIVGPDTWNAIARAGLDPARALATHDAYPALEAGGALLRVGHTGTNVMDLVAGIRPG